MSSGTRYYLNILRHFQINLINVRRSQEWTSKSDAAPHWPTWLSAMGITIDEPDVGPRFSNESMALQAATEGIGVLLAASPLSATDIKSGMLAAPFGDLQTANSITYYLVHPKRKLDDPNVQKFCQWIRKMMSQNEA